MVRVHFRHYVAFYLPTDHLLDLNMHVSFYQTITMMIVTQDAKILFCMRLLVPPTQEILLPLKKDNSFALNAEILKKNLKKIYCFTLINLLVLSRFMYTIYKHNTFKMSIFFNFVGWSIEYTTSQVNSALQFLFLKTSIHSF